MGRNLFFLFAAGLLLSGAWLGSGCNRPFDPVNPIPAAVPTPTYSFNATVTSVVTPAVTATATP